MVRTNGNSGKGIKLKITEVRSYGSYRSQKIFNFRNF